MATNNVIKKVEINAANNLKINKELGAEAQNIDVSYDANGDIIEDISITAPSSVSSLSNALRQTQGAVTWTEENILGAKNLIPIGKSLNATQGNGITYTVSTDGIITMSGLASATSRYTVEFPEALNNTYKFTIDCANFNVAGVGVTVILRKSNGNTNIAWFGTSGETDGTKEISIPANSDIKYFTIIVASGASIINLVLKPMLRIASIKNKIYVPYAKTNKELTKDIEVLANRDTGHAVMNAAGVELPQRHSLQFTDSKLTDDSVNNKTKIEVIQSINQSQYSTMPDGIYNIVDEAEEVLRANDIYYNSTSSNLEADNVQEAIDQICDIKTFNISTSIWTANQDSTTSTDYPYIAVINTTDYTNDSRPIWQLVGAGIIPTSVEQESIDYVLYALFSSSNITLYAIDEPTSNLVLQVKGA